MRPPDQRKRSAERQREYRKNNPPKRYCDLSEEEKVKQRFYAKSWRENNPEGYKRIVLKKNYGITLEDYQQMLDDSNGVCAICDQPFKFDNKHEPCIDHDHKTGQVRGLLCVKCNMSLGGFDDNVAILLNAIEYLRAY